MALSKTQIDKLGDRLRDSATVSPDDLDLLEQVLGAYQGSLTVAQELVDSAVVGIESTARLKTSQTLREKLQRIPVRLTQMEDIAGIRIVRAMDRIEQDEVVASLVRVLPETRVFDRRVTPSHGYRAVHVVAKVEGRLVEIQVRTRYQDVWAQVVEKLGDLWGRQIRYGEGPVNSDAVIAEFSDGSVLTREKFWRTVQATGDAFNGIEKAVVDRSQAEAELAAAAPHPSPELRARVRRLRRDVRTLDDAAQVLVESLPAMTGLLDDKVAE